MVRLIEVEPGRWRVDKERHKPARSDLPIPNIISDAMPPTEQVDGLFYESKSAFRAKGRSLGLIEVGNEKPKPRPSTINSAAEKEKRRNTIKRAVAQFQSR